MTLQERKERWERELSRMSGGDRWGEIRRFAGRSAGIRLERRRWLISRIAEAETKLTANEQPQGRGASPRPSGGQCWASSGYILFINDLKPN